MAWTTNPYCQLSDVKFAINNISNNSTVDDPWISALIVQAQAAIDDYLGFSFQQDGPGSTRVYDGTGEQWLLMEDTLAITQVQETTYNTMLGANGIWVSGTTQVLDITADIFMQPNNVTPQNLLRRRSHLPFAEGAQNYAVTGTFGQPSIPQDITRACARLAIHYYKMREANYTDQVADGQFGKGIKFIPAMPEDIAQVLDRHKPRLFLVGRTG